MKFLRFLLVAALALLPLSTAFDPIALHAQQRKYAPVACQWNYTVDPVNGPTATYCGTMVSPITQMNSQSVTGEPSLVYTYGGLQTLSNTLYNVPETLSNGPEGPMTLASISSNGSANVQNNYRFNLQSIIQANPGSASIWGEIASASYNGSSFANNPGILVKELDLNMGNQIAYGGLGTPNQGNLLLTGSTAANPGQFAECICYAGVNPLWNYGLAFWDNNAKEVTTSDVFDLSHTPAFITDQGYHVNSVSLQGTDSGFAIQSHSTFKLDDAGNISNNGTVSSLQAHSGLAFFSTGSAPTLTTGTCAGSGWVGGRSVGKFTTAAACSAGTIIISGLATSSNGYVCNAQDQTSGSGSLRQTASTTTSCTLTATTTAGDSLVVSAQGF